MDIEKQKKKADFTYHLAKLKEQVGLESIKLANQEENPKKAYQLRVDGVNELKEALVKFQQADRMYEKLRGEEKMPVLLNDLKRRVK